MAEILELTPASVLVFDNVVAGSMSNTDLRLKNNSPTSSLAFKVSPMQIKTTSPKSYVVKPNIGLIEPGKSAVISLTLNASSDMSRFKHKFLILYTECAIPETSTIEAITQLFETTISPLQVKLDVAFGAPTQELQASIYEEARSEPLRVVSAGQLSDIKVRKAQLETFVVGTRQKKKIEEKLRLQNSITKINEEDSVRIRKSQLIAGED
jgi:hypothetical protein